MATVTGMTAEAMLAIRDGTIVDGHFDTAGHIILTKYDGTLIDGGAVLAATTGQSGIVELATNAETQAGTDAVRAVTPAGLASLPGYRVQIVSGIAESATPAAWPYATSLQSVSAGSGWTPNGGAGTIVTESIDSTRTAQTFYENSGGTASTKAWVREYNSAVGGGGWTAWAQMMLMVQLNAASFTQTTTRGNYPSGLSRLYYTTATSSAWDFAGLAGEVETYIEGTDFGRQTFTQHVGGSSTPVRWFRTATAAGGWTAWQKMHVEFPASTSWTPTWTTSSGLRTPSLGNATVDCRYFKDGRKVDCKFEIVFGSSTNFGASPLTTDNWLFGLPVPAARVGDSMGFIHMQSGGTGSNTMMARAKTSGTTSTFILSMAGGMFSGTPVNPGDVDSISPWTWASTDYIRGNFTYESAT
jgi:hypothetical protein